MSLSAEFRDHVMDMLAPLRGASAKSMFGGAGLYWSGVMFGLIANDVLYFRTDSGNRADYEAAGCGPFKPWDDKPMTMPYHQVPDDVMEDGEELCRWARVAWETAKRNAKAKPSKSKPKKK